MSMKNYLAICLVVILVAAVFVTAIGTGVSVADDSLSGGSVAEDDPIEIYDWYDLNTTRENLSGNHVLMNDLDEETDGYDELVDTEDGWEPISDFRGTFDGNEHEIRDLYINRTASVGLFETTEDGAEIKDLGLVDLEINGGIHVGALVGNNRARIENSYARGKVNGERSVGGLVGRNYNTTVEDSYATTDVSGNRHVGGLLGWNSGNGKVENSYAEGAISGDSHVGGLVGFHGGDTILDSYAEGDVSGKDYLGGFVGYNGGTIENSNATGEVSGTRLVGGLVGWNPGTIVNSYATGTVSGESYDVGGLVGSNYPGSRIEKSYATGNVNGERSVGGLIGRNSGTVEDSYSTGDVSGEVSLGGLIGDNYGTVKNSQYNIDEVLIDGENHITIGGIFDDQYQDWIEDRELDIDEYDSLELVDDHYEISDVQGVRDLLGFADREEYEFKLTGDIDLSDSEGLYVPYLKADFDGDGFTISNPQINKSFANHLGMFGFIDGSTIQNVGVSKVYISGNMTVGGLAGMCLNGTIENSYATGNVSGERVVGGLVGGNRDGTIESSYAKVDVSGENAVGGLVGVHHLESVEHTILKNSYATGNVSGEENVGGIVGRNQGTVENSYATGNVSGEEDVGGLVGDNRGTVENSYWDVESTGQDESDGGTGLTTEEMIGEAAEENMDGFDFEEIWDAVKEDEGDVKEDGYPILQELDRKDQLKAQGIYEEEEDVIPGFTTILLLLASIIAVAIHWKRKVQIGEGIKSN